jgi:hypothetical protein
MKIVAFLQNMWVRPNQVEHTRQLIARDATGKLRERLIAYALFSGCLTGRRLRQALGHDYCEQIIWEEANPTISGNSSEYFPPDVIHMAWIMYKHLPEVVICFSRPAESELRELCFNRAHFIASIHPASRGADTMARLRAVRITLDALCHPCSRFQASQEERAAAVSSVQTTQSE